MIGAFDAYVIDHQEQRELEIDYAEYRQENPHSKLDFIQWLERMEMKQD